MYKSCVQIVCKAAVFGVKLSAPRLTQFCSTLCGFVDKSVYTIPWPFSLGSASVKNFLSTSYEC